MNAATKVRNLDMILLNAERVAHWTTASRDIGGGTPPVASLFEGDTHH